MVRDETEEADDANADTTMAHQHRVRLGGDSQHAVLPARPPPPFPEPVLLPARRIPGLVLTPPPHRTTTKKTDHGDEAEMDDAAKIVDDATSDGNNFRRSSLRAASRPTTLERRASVAGNILLVHVGKQCTKAFMLQRKIQTTVFGSVRVGYVLKDPPSGEVLPGACWEVAERDGGGDDNDDSEEEEDDDESHANLVAVTIEDKTQVLRAPPRRPTAQDPQTELSALQWVAASTAPDHVVGNDHHVVGIHYIAADESHVYTIAPYHQKGSLFEHCAKVGRLREPDARFFFRQILKVRPDNDKSQRQVENVFHSTTTFVPFSLLTSFLPCFRTQGLQTLQRAGLCHRDLNLQNVVLQGSSRCCIGGLACALRVPIDPETGIPHRIEPQPPCASNPQTIAPELLRGTEPFDGYAVDLWAAGIMLLTMLFGADVLFAAPVAEDPKFQALCSGDWRRYAEDLHFHHRRFRHRPTTEDKSEDEPPPPPSLSLSTSTTTHPAISDAALDLLQQMLRADPQARLSLSQVLQHPWVLTEADGSDGPEAAAAPDVARQPTGVHDK